MGRMRLDQCLVDRGLSATRSRARDAILRGEVTVDGAAVSRPGQRVGPDATIAVAPEAERYVSRGALKLEHALDTFSVDPCGHVAVDIGASTGGSPTCCCRVTRSTYSRSTSARGNSRPVFAKIPA